MILSGLSGHDEPCTFGAYQQSCFVLGYTTTSHLCSQAPAGRYIFDDLRSHILQHGWPMLCSKKIFKLTILTQGMHKWCVDPIIPTLHQKLTFGDYMGLPQLASHVFSQDAGADFDDCLRIRVRHSKTIHGPVHCRKGRRARSTEGQGPGSPFPGDVARYSQGHTVSW